MRVSVDSRVGRCVRGFSPRIPRFDGSCRRNSFQSNCFLLQLPLFPLLLVLTCFFLSQGECGTSKCCFMVLNSTYLYVCRTFIQTCARVCLCVQNGRKNWIEIMVYNSSARKTGTCTSERISVSFFPPFSFSFSLIRHSPVLALCVGVNKKRSK